MIRCAVFDFDGTLVDSNRIKRQAFIEVADTYRNGSAVMDGILRVAADRDRYWIFDAFARDLQETADVVELAERYTRICQERIAAAPEVVGAKASLECLHGRGIQLFLNSATPTVPLATLARLRHLASLFKGICGAPAKKRDNLAAIRAQYRFSPEEIVVVGDGESDRNSAEKIGCHFVAVDSDGNNFTQVPSRRIPDMAGLPEIVLAIS